jgi:hypothetical protein
MLKPLEIFKLLNNETHRTARENVYNANSTDAFTAGSMKDSIAMVRADFNQVGTLLNGKLIPKQAILEEYWYTIIICWEALENHIAEERIMRRYPTYMQNFERQKNDAKLYWKKNHPEVRKVNIYTTTSNQ